MRNNIVEAVIGIIVLVVAGFFLNFSFTSQQSGSNDSYNLIAHFDRIDGLNSGGDIRISGVKVGNTSKLEVNPKTFQAKVIMNIRADFKIPDDSSAEIVSEGFMGGKYIALVPGSSETYLKAGEEIAYTQSAISLEALIGKFLFNKSDDAKKDAPSK